MKVHLFGKFADCAERSVELAMGEGEVTVGQVRAALGAKYPQLRDELVSSRVKAAVGDVIVGEDERLAPDSVIDFFPPVSGG